MRVSGPAMSVTRSLNRNSRFDETLGATNLAWGVLASKKDTSGERSLTGPPPPTQHWTCPYPDCSRLQRYLPWNISALLKISNNRPNPLYLVEFSY